MLALMGFGGVAFWPSLPNVQTAENHPVRSGLFANGIESNGRVLGFVYPGEIAAGLTDRDRIFVHTALLDASVNATLVSEGLAYAELYSTMPLSLLERMPEIGKAARHAGIGFWSMFPKLYRRLVKYFDDGFTG